MDTLSQEIYYIQRDASALWNVCLLLVAGSIRRPLGVSRYARNCSGKDSSCEVPDQVYILGMLTSAWMFRAVPFLMSFSVMEHY
jgi:hypothetical protein